jgi:hypothetical protein
MFLQPFKALRKGNILLSLFNAKTRVGQLTFGMRFENWGDEILKKFNSVKSILIEHLSLSFIHIKLKNLSAEKRWKDFYLIKL